MSVYHSYFSDTCRPLAVVSSFLREHSLLVLKPLCSAGGAEQGRLARVLLAAKQALLRGAGGAVGPFPGPAAALALSTSSERAEAGVALALGGRTGACNA